MTTHKSGVVVGVGVGVGVGVRVGMMENWSDIGGNWGVQRKSNWGVQRRSDGNEKPAVA